MAVRLLLGHLAVWADGMRFGACCNVSLWVLTAVSARVSGAIGKERGSMTKAKPPSGQGNRQHRKDTTLSLPYINRKASVSSPQTSVHTHVHISIYTHIHIVTDIDTDYTLFIYRSRKMGRCRYRYRYLCRYRYLRAYHVSTSTNSFTSQNLPSIDLAPCLLVLVFEYGPATP